MLSKITNQVSNRVSKYLDTLFYRLLLGVIASGVLIFIFWPLVEVIKESIYPNGKLTFQLYSQLLSQDSYLILNSCLVALLTTLLTTGLGLAVGLYFTFVNQQLRKIIFIILLLTMVAPPFVSSLAYIKLFGRRGLITYHLLGLTLDTYGWQGIVLMQTVSQTSLASLIIIGGLQGINSTLIQAAYDLKVGLYHLLVEIMIPLAKPAIIVAALLSFVKSLADFGTPIIIGGGFDVLATEAYLNVIAYFNFSRAAALGGLILVPAVVAFIFYRYYQHDLQMSSQISASQWLTKSCSVELSGKIKILLTMLSWGFILIITLQYLTIILTAVSKYHGGELVVTLEHIRNFDFKLIASFLRSILYSLIAGVVSSSLGLLLAYFIEHSQQLIIKGLDLIATLPYILPGTFFGIGYILAFNQPPLALTGTALIVVLNFIYRQLPLVTKVGSSYLNSINSELEMAAQDLQASQLMTLKDIIIPLLKPAFLISFVNTFAVTMTSIGAVIFLIYPGGKVATVELFNAIDNGEYGVGAVMAVLIMVITLGVNLLISRLLLQE
ncbi:MAG: ABC transporter permease [Bacillota bacterium]